MVATCLILRLMMDAEFAAGTVIVVPNAYEAFEGEISNVWPFDNPFNSMRYQQVFDASAFGQLAPGGEFITQIAFRPDAIFGDAFSTLFPDIQINLSTSLAGPDGLSTTFMDNVGADDTEVFARGPLFLSSADTGPVPRDFDIVITLTTPFLYDPSAGNLLLDVRNFVPVSTTPFDAVEMMGDSVSRRFAFDVNDPNAIAGGGPTIGLITQFVTPSTSVPEPGTALLMLAGAGSLFGLRQLRRRSRGSRCRHSVNRERRRPISV
jgi:hypothetical protein